MRKNLCGVAFLMAGVVGLGAQSGTPPKPTRVNRAIQMLEQRQPIYYTQTSGGGYEEGRKLAQTASDYITYDMEHAAYDMAALRAFMRGLVDGGPTPTGHRTPAVIVTVPVTGIDELTVRANSWVFQQTLAAGVHGILFCHSRTPEAVRRFVEAVGFPFTGSASIPATSAKDCAAAAASVTPSRSGDSPRKSTWNGRMSGL